MGRAGIRPDDDARWVFNRLVEAYADRPPYPAALVERLAALAGGPGARVAELGAGTGLLALPLARLGLEVHAVEPARAMLARLEATAGPGVVPVHAAGEATGLPAGAFDLVVLADALQWLDPDRGGREVARLLRPGGRAAVVEPRFAPTPLMAGLAALLERANPRARRGEPPLLQFFALAAGARFETERFDQEVALQPAALEGCLRSLSVAGPALRPDALDVLLDGARALAERHGAVWARELRLHHAARAAPPPGR